MTTREFRRTNDVGCSNIAPTILSRDTDQDGDLASGVVALISNQNVSKMRFVLHRLHLFER